MSIVLSHQVCVKISQQPKETNAYANSQAHLFEITRFLYDMLTYSYITAGLLLSAWVINAHLCAMAYLRTLVLNLWVVGPSEIHISDISITVCNSRKL